MQPTSLSLYVGSPHLQTIPLALYTCGHVSCSLRPCYCGPGCCAGVLLKRCGSLEHLRALDWLLGQAWPASTDMMGEPFDISLVSFGTLIVHQKLMNDPQACLCGNLSSLSVCALLVDFIKGFRHWQFIWRLHKFG